MEDLLNDDDFIVRRPYYNPRKEFKVFYIIAFAQLVAIFFTVLIFEPDDFLLGVGIFLLLFAMPFIMAFYGKIIRSRLQTLAVGIFTLLAIFYLPMIVAAIFVDSDINTGITCIIVFTINYVLSLTIILPIARKKHKRLNLYIP